MFDITGITTPISTFVTAKNAMSRDKMIKIASDIIYEEHNKGIDNPEKGGRSRLGAETLAERMINYFEGGGSPRTEVEKKVFSKIK